MDTILGLWSGDLCFADFFCGDIQAIMKVSWKLSS